jgi:hypothetical protein
MQFAHERARGGDFAQARGELALVDPRPALVSKWDKFSAPLPEYHYLHGLVNLGLGLRVDFPNPLIETAEGAPRVRGPEISYDAAIAATGNADIVPQPHTNYPDDSRPAIYRAALADLDALLDQPPAGWPPEARAAAERIRAKLQAGLDAVVR